MLPIVNLGHLIAIKQPDYFPKSSIPPHSINEPSCLLEMVKFILTLASEQCCYFCTALLSGSPLNRTISEQNWPPERPISDPNGAITSSECTCIIQTVTSDITMVI